MEKHLLVSWTAATTAAARVRGLSARLVTPGKPAAIGYAYAAIIDSPAPVIQVMRTRRIFHG
jgi:hypothetical protein